MKCILFLILLCFFYCSPVEARRGCCSWHGGVCGCSNGRQLCCDGSLSPSCVCANYSSNTRRDFSPKTIYNSNGKIEVYPLRDGDRVRMYLYNKSGQLYGKSTTDLDGNGFLTSYDTGLNKIGEIELKKFKPLGLAIEYYTNGVKKSEGKLIDNKRDGSWKFYYEDGVLKEKIEFDNNKLDGKRIKYFPSGLINAEENWNNDKIDGKVKIYTENKHLKYVYRYDNGIMHGVQEEYYDNGDVYTKTEYSKGILEGIYEEYYENGELKTKTNYKNGLRSGKEKYYYPSGKIMYKAKIQDNVPLDEIGYYENGNIKYNVCFTCTEDYGYCFTEENNKIILNKEQMEFLKTQSPEFQCN